MERLAAIAATLMEETGAALEYLGAEVGRRLVPYLDSLSRSLGDRAELLLAAALLIAVMLALYHRIVVRRALERAQQGRARWNERPDSLAISDVREEIASLSREVTALQYHLRARQPAVQELEGVQSH